MDTYKADSNLPVNDYFKDTVAKEWNFDTYRRYKNNKDFKFATAKADFVRDVNILLNQPPSELPSAFKNNIGRLLTNIRRVNNDTSSQPAMNISGNVNQIINNPIHSNISSNKRQYDDFDLFPPLNSHIQQKRRANLEEKEKQSEEDEDNEEIQQVLLFDVNRDFAAECHFEEVLNINDIDYSTPFKLFKLNSYKFLKNAHIKGDDVYLEEQVYKLG
jgi:hypothetical protein